MPTQKQRSDETRRVVLDATVACLTELGFAKTSTVEVQKRAGVSRGALLYHFPSKAGLLAEARDAAIDLAFKKGDVAAAATVRAAESRSQPHLEQLVAFAAAFAAAQGKREPLNGFGAAAEKLAAIDGPPRYRRSLRRSLPVTAIS